MGMLMIGMGRLLKFTISLAFALLGMTFAARVIGSRLTPDFAAVFTTANGQPCAALCLFGIIPGETAYLASEGLLRAHPLTRYGSVNARAGGALLDFHGAAFDITILQGENNRVGSISLSFPADAAPLFHAATFGHALAQIGTPHQLQLARQNRRHVRLFYPAQGVVLSGNATADRLNPADPLTFLGISTQPMFNEAWRGILLATVPWGGFRELRLYLITAAYP